MTKKFDRVLSDDEVNQVINGLAIKPLFSYRHVAKAIQDATLAKLAEQEPVATLKVDSVSGIDINYHQFQGLYNGMKLYAAPMVSQEPFAWFIDDKRVCGNRIITDLAIAKDWLETNPDKVTPLYAHSIPTDHISDVGNMIVQHGYRLVSLADIDTAIQRASVFDDGGDGADPESARSCIEILKGMLSSNGTFIDEGTKKRTIKSSNITKLSLSIDTEEMQTLLWSYLDSLEGWKLTPKEPTEEMWDGLARKIILAWDFNCKTPRKMIEFLKTSGYTLPENIMNEPEMTNLDHTLSKGTRVVILYKAMLASASKITPLNTCGACDGNHPDCTNGCALERESPPIPNS